MTARPSRAGFTLIEMMAVVLFTGIVLTAAVNFYLDVAAASRAATELTREGRRAVALLDRIAADLEASILLKTPEGLDPLENPWIFVAETRGGELGAERVKFVSRRRSARSDTAHESDLELVAYVLVPHELDEGAWDLLRWSSPRLPEARDVSFPTPDDEGTLLLAEAIGGFGLRFLGEDGTWTESWDSSQLSESGDLPLVVEVQVVPSPPGEEEELAFEQELPVFARQVAIPVRPIDLGELIGDRDGTGDGDDEEDEDDADCLTVDECLADNTEAFGQLGAQDAALVAGSGAACFADFADIFARNDIPIAGCGE